MKFGTEKAARSRRRPVQRWYPGVLCYPREIARRRVVKRWLARESKAQKLGVLHEQLECGHVVIDPGKCCRTRWCSECEVKPLYIRG